ncbi:MAG: zf-HC2 domain-containing protein [Chloroflexi bacterium]|nr:zf-HC2 domain-containing protein [Chloroflexota bacterium]MCZ6789212.1 zf-HC2 domain-containing protein [Chloroflexota bacterium]MCZ6891908.1 zf-HC2 domain-containing protein [Chloroflexota bacterium]
MSVAPTILSKIFRRSKSDCEKLREMASLHLDGELSEEERRQIEFHLEQCEMCSGFVSTLRETINMLQKLPPQGIPQELKRTILQIGDEGTPSSSQG